MLHRFKVGETKSEFPCDNISQVHYNMSMIETIRDSNNREYDMNNLGKVLTKKWYNLRNILRYVTLRSVISLRN